MDVRIYSIPVNNFALLVMSIIKRQGQGSSSMVLMYSYLANFFLQEIEKNKKELYVKGSICLMWF